MDIFAPRMPQGGQIIQSSFHRLAHLQSQALSQGARWGHKFSHVAVPYEELGLRPGQAIPGEHLSQEHRNACFLGVHDQPHPLARIVISPQADTPRTISFRLGTHARWDYETRDGRALRQLVERVDLRSVLTASMSDTPWDNRSLVRFNPEQGAEFLTAALHNLGTNCKDTLAVLMKLTTDYCYLHRAPLTGHGYYLIDIIDEADESRDYLAQKFIIPRQVPVISVDIKDGSPTMEAYAVRDSLYNKCDVPLSGPPEALHRAIVAINFGLIPSLRGKEYSNVLLVHDDQSIINAVSEGFGHAGKSLRLNIACSGPEAFHALIRNHEAGHPIDLLMAGDPLRSFVSASQIVQAVRFGLTRQRAQYYTDRYFFAP